ncbi:formyl transferase [Chloroflexota bacterium]
MEKPLRIVILTSKLPEDLWLINKIAEVSLIEGIVLPVRSRYKEFGIIQVLKKRIRRFGLFCIVNQVLLILYRLVMESQKDRKAKKKIFADKPYQYIEKRNVDTLYTEDINSEEVRNFILAKSPQLVVVSGTPLLKKRIIKSVEGRIINLHPGFAPQYRGRYGAFWPIYNKEPDLVGTTIHFLDEGIDTGDILIQQQVNYDPSDSLKTITYRQHKVGGDLLVKCLTQFGMIASSAYCKTGCPSSNYLVPGLTHYLKARNWLRREKRNGNLVPLTLMENRCCSQSRADNLETIDKETLINTE